MFRVQGLELRVQGAHTYIDVGMYRGNSLVINHPFTGPYSRPMPTALQWSKGGGRFLMSEVPLYATYLVTSRCERMHGGGGIWRWRVYAGYM